MGSESEEVHSSHSSVRMHDRALSLSLWDAKYQHVRMRSQISRFPTWPKHTSLTPSPISQPQTSLRLTKTSQNTMRNILKSWTVTKTIPPVQVHNVTQPAADKRYF